MVYKIRTRSGAAIPNLGSGTWRMGENEATHREEIRALTLALDLGLRLIDTAEMYADGGAERVVGDAIEGKRDGVFLVSKVLPHNASFVGTLSACERSLKRLRTSWIDLYLLHWPGEHPVEETLRGFTTLVEQGKIRHYGLSNFDLDEMERAEAWPGGSRVAVDQVLYNLGRRGIERRLIPWCASRKIAIMAYSPLEQGRLRPNDALRLVAQRHGATPAQIALAWTLRHDNVIAIPKAKQSAHVRDNAKAADFILTEEDLADIDRAFPPPRRDVPLDTL
jgi:diketogulonate reductase-like aldo/keto reductase